MRIGILTGGGDVPGLNPCIKAIVERVTEDGHEVVGLRRGWASVVDYDPDDPTTIERCTMPLDRDRVRTIDRSGGTVLHTSRTNPSRVTEERVPEHLADQVTGEPPYDFTDHALRVIEDLELDVLMPIGGDDTLGYGLRLHDEGVPVVAIPKTMDNDVPGTEYCIGFSTAITLSVNAINQLRTPTGSHERLAVIELFGRYSGATSLIAAHLASADRAIISEVPFDVEKLADLLMEDRARNPSNYAMVTISEGARMEEGEMQAHGEADAFGHKKLGGIGEVTGERLKEITGVGIIGQKLAYLMRSGPPDSLDLMVGSNYGLMAARLATSGEKGRMIALQGGTYTDIPVSEVGGGAREVDVDAMYDAEAYRPRIRDMAGKPMFLY